MELIFKNGNVELEKHIPYVKEYLGKVRLTRGGDTEGVWVVFSKEDHEKYNNDDLNGETIIGVLCNDSLAGVPWGTYIKVELNGGDRPFMHCEEVFGDTPEFVIADWAATQAVEGVFKDLQAGTYTLDPAVRSYLLMTLKTAPESDVTEALKSLMEQ